MINQKFELIVVSDVHLRGQNDQRFLVLCELIESLVLNPPKNFVLLGDVFDFFFGLKSYYSKKYRRLGDALAKLAKAGSTVFFYEGNHEFDLKSTPWPHINIVDSGDIVLQMADGTRVVLNHGDLIYCDMAYVRFREFVKSRVIKYLAWTLPSFILEGYALLHAKASRAKDSYRRLDHQALLKATDVWMTKNNATVGIIGHFHVPYAESIANNKRLLSMRSWDKINFLGYKDLQFYRGFYENGWSIIPAGESDFCKGVSLKK